MNAPSLPIDRRLRAVVLEALEALAVAERTGTWGEAAQSFARIVSELRARGARNAPPSAYMAVEPHAARVVAPVARQRGARGGR